MSEKTPEEMAFRRERSYLSNGEVNDFLDRAVAAESSLAEARAEAGRLSSRLSDVRKLREDIDGFLKCDRAAVAQGGGIYFSADHIRGGIAVYEDIAKRLDKILAEAGESPSTPAPAARPHVCTYACASNDCEKVVGPAPAAPGWKCKARAQGTAGGNDPADCDWPHCGCDPYADKVLAALEESGWTLVRTPAPAARPTKEEMLEKELRKAISRCICEGLPWCGPCREVLALLKNAWIATPAPGARDISEGLCQHPIGGTTCGYPRHAPMHTGSLQAEPPAGRHEYAPAPAATEEKR